MEFEKWYNSQKDGVLNPIDTFNLVNNYLKNANGDPIKAGANYYRDIEKNITGTNIGVEATEAMKPITETITGIDFPKHPVNMQTMKPTQATITDNGIIGGFLPNELKDPINEYAEKANSEFEDVRQEKTNNNQFDEAYQRALEQQKRLWEREDAIRKETQQREDTAYQRAVEDARKAGINLNLLGINPASSGGGITQATKMDNTSTNEELNLLTQEIIKNMSNEFELKENEKDRFSDLLSSALNLLLMKALFGK